MQLKVLGSSSSGNGYVIQSETEALVIEAGVGLMTVKEALDFNVMKVQGCIITHEHKDHCKYANVYEKAFPVFALSSVIRGNKLKYTTEVRPMQSFNAGRFSILPFLAHHDVLCVGYVITHPGMGSLMFLTDSFYTEYSFKGLNHIMIECNYNDSALERAIDSGLTSGYMKKRLMTTHMELETTKKILMMQDQSSLQTITLLHLSSENSDEKEMIDQLSRATGKRIYVAKKGLMVDLSLNPY
jgi:phosphoribosyl 1,2-cyclic phosphodiesterase